MDSQQQVLGQQVLGQQVLGQYVPDRHVAGEQAGEAALVVAWCAGCRGESEFVAPVGLADADPDELACLQCGWAVLVAPEATVVARSDRAA